jgi:amino acid transporter
MLVVTRIVLQFLVQHVGVMVLRVKRPELNRPFRIPLYPLPPLAAMAGFLFILVNRPHAIVGVAVAAGIGISGSLIYLVRARNLAQWPFASRTEPS